MSKIAESIEKQLKINKTLNLGVKMVIRFIKEGEKKNKDTVKMSRSNYLSSDKDWDVHRLRQSFKSSKYGNIYKP